MPTMPEMIHYAFSAALIGAGATLATDIWGIVRKRLLGMAPLDYALVGRWLVYLTRGRFRHHPIAASPAVSHERAIGWISHYLIGIAFAAILLIIWGRGWIRHPTPGPALIVGMGGVAAPFLLMQPGMGAGIAASRTPRPMITRMHSLITHGMFGIGLYATANIGSAWGLLTC
jgi:hypothetical protein